MGFKHDLSNEVPGDILSVSVVVVTVDVEDVAEIVVLDVVLRVDVMLALRVVLVKVVLVRVFVCVDEVENEERVAVEVDVLHSMVFVDVDAPAVEVTSDDIVSFVSATTVVVEEVARGPRCAVNVEEVDVPTVKDAPVIVVEVDGPDTEEIVAVANFHVVEEDVDVPTGDGDEVLVMFVVSSDLAAGSHSVTGLPGSEEVE